MDEKYMKLLFAIDDYFQRDLIIIEWKNGLKIRCRSVTGLMENDMEMEEECGLGEYSIGVSEAEVIDYGEDNYIETYGNCTRIVLRGTDDCVEIYNGCIEISLLCIPVKVSLEDGTVLWQRDKDK